MPPRVKLRIVDCVVAIGRSACDCDTSDKDRGRKTPHHGKLDCDSGAVRCLPRACKKRMLWGIDRLNDGVANNKYSESFKLVIAISAVITNQRHIDVCFLSLAAYVETRAVQRSGCPMLIINGNDGGPRYGRLTRDPSSISRHDVSAESGQMRCKICHAEKQTFYFRSKCLSRQAALLTTRPRRYRYNGCSRMVGKEYNGQFG